MDQHKVSRFILAHFTDSNGQVWTYDKTTGKHWPASPDRTGVEAHYYSVERDDGSMDTTIEDLFSTMEGEAAPVYERLAKGELPKGTDRETFGHFLGLVFTRTPGMRRFAPMVHKFGIETHIAAQAQIPKAFSALLKRMEAAGLDVSDPERLKRAMVDLSGFNLVVPKEMTLAPISHARAFADIFLKMKWSLARSPDHYLVTCDDPIFRAVDRSPYTRCTEVAASQTRRQRSLYQ